MFREHKKWTDQEWIENLNNAEPILFTNCSYYTENCLVKERIRSIWEIINGVFVRVALDYEEMEWVAIYIPEFFSSTIIKNPESKYIKDCV